MPKSIALNTALRLALALPVVCLLGAASWTSLELSRADMLFRANTTESVREAARLDPRNGRYQAWLAELLEFDGADSSAALDAASRLTPTDSRVWIRRGLNAELAGNVAGAEELLLRAAAIDRLLEPSWTLMNFYFRQGREERFWHWAKRAFPMSYDNRTPLFELCWRMRPDAAFIAETALSQDFGLSRRFLEYLINRNETTQAAALATSLAPRATPVERQLYSALAVQLIRNGDAESAVRVWNVFAEDKLEPAKAASLTNGDFRRQPAGEGFDWAFSSPSGISLRRGREGLEVELSGHQDGSAELIRQIIPVLPGRRYRLTFRMASPQIEGPSGLQVRVGEQSSATSLQFNSSAAKLLPVIVEYKRPTGHVRAEGTVVLNGFRLEFAE